MSFFKLRWMPITVLLFLLLAACNMPSNRPSGGGNISALHTQAAQTVMVQLTQMAQGSTPSPVSLETQSPGETQPPVTAAPSNPTATRAPASSATPKATSTPLPCNLAQFVKDVTVPDDTAFSPGVPFVKTWRLKNVGSCTWNTDYKAVFVDGDAMGGETVPVPEMVKPGETVDISVNLTAPQEPGTYKGNWMLRDASERFGIGAGADKPFWVQIKVAEPTSGVVYNFATNYCAATWESPTGELPCPGKTSDESGFVVKLDNPNLESRKENEAALWTNPDMVTDGWITGTYPAFKVKAGDHFLADIGCLAGHPQCDVIFQLKYQVGNQTPQELGKWFEVYDGKITRVDIDLTPLAGQSVKFVLAVSTHGDYHDDAAFWLVPHIFR